MCGSKCREFKLFTFLAVEFMGHYAAVKTFRKGRTPLEDKTVWRSWLKSISAAQPASLKALASRGLMAFSLFEKLFKPFRSFVLNNKLLCVEASRLCVGFYSRKGEQSRLLPFLLPFFLGLHRRPGQLILSGSLDLQVQVKAQEQFSPVIQS